MDPIIKVRHLSKTFVSLSRGHRRVKAMDDVSLDVYSNEILGVLGPNGAGKTTFLNMLTSLLLPDSGTIEILGKPLRPRNYKELRQQFNMSSGHPNFPWSMTVEENLRFYGRLYNLSGPALKHRVHALMEMFDLAPWARQRFDELSSGTKQKLALAKCLMNQPKIIFLDEPTVALDPDIAVKIRHLILDIYKTLKVTILLTTHNMQEAEQMCQRIAFIKEGRLIKLASPEELKTAQGSTDLEAVFLALAEAKVEPALESRLLSPSLQEYARHEEEVRVRDGKDIWAEGKRWLNRCRAFTYRNYLFAVRNFFAFAELAFWPIMSLLSIGLLGRYLQLEDKALAFVLTGTIAAGILQVTQLDVAYGLLYEVWAKSLKHTFLTPVGVSEHLFGSWVIGIGRGTIIFCILGLSAILFFGFPFPSLSVTLIFLSGIFSFSLLLGIFVSYLLLLFGQKAEITAWMFSYLFMLLCGIYYPVNMLPKPFFYLAQLVPLTYFLEFFRQSFGFTPVLSHVLLKGFGEVAVYLFLGLFLMKHSFTLARKRGIIVKLSE